MVAKKKAALKAAASAKPRAPKAPKAAVHAAVPAETPAAASETTGRSGLYVTLGLLAVLAALGGQAVYMARARAAMKFDFIRKGDIIGQGLADGQGTGPKSLAGDSNGNVFFLDGEDRSEMRLQKFDADMKFVAKYKAAHADEALGHALDVDVDAKGDVFVLQAAGQVLVLDNNLRWLSAFKVAVNDPSCMAVSADGRVFIGSRGDNEVQIFQADGRAAGVFGAPGTDSGDVVSPARLTFDGEGRLAVLEDLPGVLRVKVFSKDMKEERDFKLADVPMCAPLRIAGDSRGLLYVNDFDGGKGVMVYNLDKGKEVGQVKGTNQGDLFITPGSIGANRFTGRIYVHTIPGLIPCAMPAGHV
jgi:sugar lactone lactonase YvrE